MRRPPANLELWVDGDKFAPGDDVNIRITIASDKGLQVREGLITLECVETFWRSEYNAATKTSTLNKHTQKLVEIPLQFISDVQIHSGVAHREAITLQLPEDVPTTLVGKNANISWQVKVALDVPGARDLREERPITVLPPPSPSKPETPPTGLSSPVVAEQVYGECRLRLELPVDNLSVVDSLTGRLRLDALQDCDFSEIRVALVRQEEAGDKKSNHVEGEVVLERDATLRANLSREWRFTLVVPQGLWPSAQVSKTSLTWSVKGIFARSRRTDFAVEKVIDVTMDQ